MNFIGSAQPLSPDGHQAILDSLGVPAPVLWAVLKVETRGCGFLVGRQPRILYERHIFNRRTQGRFDATAPDISFPERGGYVGGAGEYARLEKAMKLDSRAALESTSWGIGQVMGFNTVDAGFATVEKLVKAASEGEDAQLQTMADFIKTNQLHKFLAKRDWAGFALRYNGAQYKDNNYDTLLAVAHAGYSVSLPDLKVRQTQVFLFFLGYDIGEIDGIIGRRTRSGILDFRTKAGLGTSQDVDDQLLAALAKSVKKLKKT